MKRIILLLETKIGSVKLELYNETPKHRDNFVKLVKEGVYENLSFHRIIESFMIQAGDLSTRQNKNLDLSQYGYNVEPEINSSKFYHRKGALAAARLGNDMNPERRSSVSQFYIVTGRVYKLGELKELEKNRFEILKLDIQNRLQTENTKKVKELYRAGNRLALTEFREELVLQAAEEAKARRSETKYNEEQIDAYTVIGGAPNLDGEYTVFGSVVEGLNIIDKIEKMRVDENDRPYEEFTFSIKSLKE